MNGNRILIHKVDGTIRRVLFIPGLFITFRGNNSVVNIYEPCKFKFQIGTSRSHIKINGNNNVINICSNEIHKIKSLRIRDIGNNNRIEIGKNLYATDGIDVDFANNDNLELRIGDNCMFGQNIKLMLGDHHKILSNFDNSELNKPQSGILVGNHVWLARNVTLLKDTKISDNSVVGYGSIVTKQFEETNVLITGTPAKIVKRDVNWSF